MCANRAEISKTRNVLNNFSSQALWKYLITSHKIHEREKTSKCIGKYESESFDICLVFHSVTNRRVPIELLALAIGVPAGLITMYITLSVVLGNRFVGWFLKVMRTK